MSTSLEQLADDLQRVLDGSVSPDEFQARHPIRGETCIKASFDRAQSVAAHYGLSTNHLVRTRVLSEVSASRIEVDDCLPDNAKPFVGDRGALDGDRPTQRDGLLAAPDAGISIAHR